MYIKNTAKIIALLSFISFSALSIEVQIKTLFGYNQKLEFDDNMTIPQFEDYIRGLLPEHSRNRPFQCLRNGTNVLEEREKTIGQIFTGQRFPISNDFDGCIVLPEPPINKTKNAAN